MKKILIAAVVCVCLATAGTAVAGPHGWGGSGGRHHGMYGYGGTGAGYGMGGCGNRGYGGGFCTGRQGGVNLPQEIQDKRTEAEKVAIDLRAELSKNPVNRAKALDLHKKHQALRQAISDWCFQQRLNATQ